MPERKKHVALCIVPTWLSGLVLERRIPWRKSCAAGTRARGAFRGLMEPRAGHGWAAHADLPPPDHPRIRPAKTSRRLRKLPSSTLIRRPPEKSRRLGSSTGAYLCEAAHREHYRSRRLLPGQLPRYGANFPHTSVDLLAQRQQIIARQPLLNLLEQLALFRSNVTA